MPKFLSLPAPLTLLLTVGACMQEPTGEFILFDSERDHGVTGNQSIYVMAPDGSNVRRLAHIEGVTSWLADWSPDRKKIVFSSNPTRRWDDLYVMDADGGNWRQLTDTPNASEHDAAWSPDGRHIAYDRAEIIADGRRQNAQLWIIDANGSNPRALTSGSSLNMLPAWSPNGSTIAFVSNRHAVVDIDLIGTDEENSDIYIMERDGSNVRRLTECAGWVSSPAWSPDGQRIAFGCDGGDQPPRNLHVMNADGSNQRLLIKDVFYRPTWSPDGESIAYNCNPADPLGLDRPPQFEQFEICVIHLDGSGFRTLTNNEVMDGHADWW